MENAADSPPRINLGDLDGRRALARRVDLTTGITEEVEFFGSDSLKMFGCTYLPAGQATAGVVICPPLEGEMRRAHRKEVMLARTMAERGLAVQRFHYRGSGQSHGLPWDATFETMCQDATAAAERLMNRTQTDRVGFVGTRWGALVAAAAAQQRFDSAPLALWEPIVDTSRYFREVLRTRLMQGLKTGGDRRTIEGLVEEIRQKGFVDAVGGTIYRPLYDTGVGHTLQQEVGDRPRPLLLVQIGPNSVLIREYADLVGWWQGLGFAVQAELIEEDEGWWLGLERFVAEEANPASQRLLRVTEEWLIRCLSRVETAP